MNPIKSTKRKKIVHKASIYQNLVLPLSMNDTLLSLKLSKTTLYNTYYILWAILTERKREYRNMEVYRPMPASRLKKMLGRYYFKPLEILLDNGIIERTDTYGEGLCYYYRISPRYFGETETVKVKFSYTAKLSPKDFNSMKSEIQLFKEAYRGLDIPFIKLYDRLKEKVTNLSLRDYKIGPLIHWEYNFQTVYEINDNWKIITHSLSKEEALSIGTEKGKILVQDGARVIMVEPNYFIETKKRYIELTWKASIENLTSEKTLYAKRNKRNNRLDTNFTNMSSELFNIICEHNNLEQLDISNSQPALLSNVIEKEGIQGPDVELFNQLTRDGEFYEHFMKFGKTRKEAKNMMFNILFGESFSSKMARLFKKEFPTIAKFITGYKKEHGYNEFSVMLQKVESSIFIDKIFYPLSKDGKKVFTKHDSVCVKMEDYNYVVEKVKQVFKEIDFQVTIKNERLNKAI